jgi:hypothetical protein
MHYRRQKALALFLRVSSLQEIDVDLLFGGVCDAFITIAQSKQRKMKMLDSAIFEKKYNYFVLEKMILDGPVFWYL